MKEQRRLVLVGLVALMLAASWSIAAWCPEDPEIMCRIACQTSGPHQGWCWNESAGACLLVMAGGSSGGCIGGFSHCSCQSMPGG